MSLTDWLNKNLETKSQWMRIDKRLAYFGGRSDFFMPSCVLLIYINI